MHPTRSAFLLVGLLACGGHASPEGAAPAPSSTSGATASTGPSIGADEIASSGGATAWDVVDRLHRRWFRDQLTGKEVSIYEDNQSVGGADKLRGYPSRDVAELRYFDGQTAVRRWGPGVEGGVIMVVRNRT
ncbi:MAG TPA: hypothetical protein VJQ44_09605 [Gemmatimonadales bacterium]|nr:hypothetical protein [Gemmatimonadales bacterium]